jgi:hypothetical protein
MVSWWRSREEVKKVGPCRGLGPVGAAHRRRQGRRPRGRKVAAGAGLGLRVRRKSLRCLGFWSVIWSFYTAWFSLGWMLSVDLQIDGSGWLRALWARLSPGGIRLWAAWPAQPLAAGPGAHAGAVGWPRAGFRCWVGSVSHAQYCFLFFKFCISEACFICCLCLFAVFHLSYISV